MSQSLEQSPAHLAIVCFFFGMSTHIAGCQPEGPQPPPSDGSTTPDVSDAVDAADADSYDTTDTADVVPPDVGPDSGPDSDTDVVEDVDGETDAGPTGEEATAFLESLFAKVAERACRAAFECKQTADPLAYGDGPVPPFTMASLRKFDSLETCIDRAPDRTTRVSKELRELMHEAESGHYRIDSDAAGVCLQSISADPMFPCERHSSFVTVLDNVDLEKLDPQCDDALVGAREQGARCTRHGVCSGDLVCRPDDSTECGGTCETTDVGATCDDDADCSGELECAPSRDGIGAVCTSPNSRDEGERCAETLECGDGLVCVPDPDDSEADICAPRRSRAAGQPCGFEGVCQSGLTCQGNTCEELEGANECVASWDCAPDEDCAPKPDDLDVSICIPESSRAKGEACGNTSDCSGDLDCQPNPSDEGDTTSPTQICVEPGSLQSGDACSKLAADGGEPCEEPLICEERVCVRPRSRTEGESCKRDIVCGENLVCDSVEDECRPIELVGSGSTCDDERRFCEPGLACLDMASTADGPETGTCERPVDQSSDCQYDWQCGPGLFCDLERDEAPSFGTDPEDLSGTCRPVTESGGRTCERQSPCPPAQFCVDGTCQPTEEAACLVN